MKDYNIISSRFIFVGLLACLAIIPRIISAQNVINDAPEHFNKFNSVNGGWCAADATISLLLPDGKTLWLFGDTFIGEKNGEFGINPAKSRMINNAAIIEDGNVLTAHYGGTFENPSSFIPGVGQDFFWPEHAIVENDTLKVFAVRIKYKDNGTPGFNFEVGTTYKASYKYPDIEHIETVKFKSVTDTAMRFGACVIKSGDHTYIFGVKDTTSGGLTYPLPYLARVSESIEEPWQFYADSETWSYDCNDARPVGDRPMSESFYVFEKNGKFYLIMHEIWLVGELFILEADNITGPWNRSLSGGIENRFAVIKPHTGNISYNLFAHPQFQNNGKILISFNVNTTNFNSIYQDTRNYRARFYWLDVEGAVTATIPDTAKLFDTPVGIVSIDSDNHSSKLSYHPFTKSLQISDIYSPASLCIFGIDGRLYLKREIYDDTEIDCSHLPGKFMIIRLEDQWGVETKKIVLI
jgi:hypothetical protein